MPVIRIAIVLACLAWGIAPATAQVCDFSATDIDFGNVNLGGGSFPSTTGTFTATCSGTPGQAIRICANFNAGSGGADASGDPRYMVQGATRLGYNIFRSNGVGQVWGSHLWAAAPRPPALTLTLNASGNGSLSQVMNARIYNGQGALGTGTYASSFAGSQSQVDYGYAASFTCGAGLSARARSVPFTVRATNNSSCTVATTMLNFGAQPDLSSARDATNTITVNCSPGTAYAIGLSNGSGGGTNPAARRMTNAATSDVVTYGIYRDAARTQVWGDVAGSTTLSGTGTGTGQSFTGYGRVPVQATPAPLTYTDTVVVTITY